MLIIQGNFSILLVLVFVFASGTANVIELKCFILAFGAECFSTFGRATRQRKPINGWKTNERRRKPILIYTKIKKGKKCAQKANNWHIKTKQTSERHVVNANGNYTLICKPLPTAIKWRHASYVSIFLSCCVRSEFLSRLFEIWAGLMFITVSNVWSLVFSNSSRCDCPTVCHEKAL